VHLSELTTVELADALNCGDVHLALRALTPLQKTQDLACRPLWREHLVAVVPTGHPLATVPAPLPITALADFPLVTIGGQMGQEVRYETDLAFAEADERPRVAWQTDQPQTLANFVRAGLGVGVTNALAMRISDTTGLEVIEVGSLEQGRAVGVFWDPHRYLPPAATVMLEMLVDTPAPEGTHPVDARPT
jgi:DNA-binding transcriptional LysR family regulator